MHAASTESYRSVFARGHASRSGFDQPASSRATAIREVLRPWLAAAAILALPFQRTYIKTKMEHFLVQRMPCIALGNDN
eukprot:6141133-Pleurochrysis_carterae.AAC.1